MIMKILSVNQRGKTKAPLPKTIENAVQNSKPKLRVAYSQPGRYVLKSARGVFAIVRLKKEAKYVPSMKQKIFALREMEALASEYSPEELEAFAAFDDAVGSGPYEESIKELDAEAAARKGAGGQAAGTKMGRKKRAPNMLAPGWHMFSLPKGATRMTKAYIGPRVSARRILGLIDNGGKDTAPKETSKPKVASKPSVLDTSEISSLTKGQQKNAKKLASDVENIQKLVDENSDHTFDVKGPALRSLLSMSPEIKSVFRRNRRSIHDPAHIRAGIPVYRSKVVKALKDAKAQFNKFMNLAKKQNARKLSSKSSTGSVLESTSVDYDISTFNKVQQKNTKQLISNVENIQNALDSSKARMLPVKGATLKSLIDMHPELRHSLGHEVNGTEIYRKGIMIRRGEVTKTLKVAQRQLEKYLKKVVAVNARM